jgi:uncharacterized protein HemY
MALTCLDNSAEALFELGEYDAAAKAVADALSIDASNPIALRLRDQILNQIRQ